MFKGATRTLADRSTTGKHRNWVNGGLQTYHNSAVARGRELGEAPTSAAATMNRDGTSAIPLEASPMVLQAGNDKNKSSVSFRPDFKNGKDRFVYFDDKGDLLLLSDSSIRGLGMGKEAELALEDRTMRVGSPILQPFGPKSTKTLMAERSAIRSQAIKESLHVAARPILSRGSTTAADAQLDGPSASSSSTPSITTGNNNATTDPTNTGDGTKNTTISAVPVGGGSSTSAPARLSESGAITVEGGVPTDLTPMEAVLHAKETAKELGYDKSERMELEELAFQVLQHSHDREYIKNLFAIDAEGNDNSDEAPQRRRRNSSGTSKVERIGVCSGDGKNNVVGEEKEASSTPPPPTGGGNTDKKTGTATPAGENHTDDQQQQQQASSAAADEETDENNNKNNEEEEEEDTAEDRQATVDREFARASAYRRNRATSRNSANARRKPLTYEKALSMSGNRIVIELAKNMVQPKDEMYDSRAMGWLGSPERKTYAETATSAGRFASKVRNTYFSPADRAGMMRGDKFESGGIDNKRLEMFGEKAQKLNDFMHAGQASVGGKSSQKGGGLSGGTGDAYGATGSFTSHQSGRLDDAGAPWSDTAIGGKRGNAPDREKPFALNQDHADDEGMSSHNRRAAKFQSYRQELNQLQQSRIQTMEHEELLDDSLKYLEGFIDFAPVRRGAQRAQTMYYEQQANIHPQMKDINAAVDGADGMIGTELLLPRSALQGRLVGLLFFDDSEYSLHNLSRFGHFIHEQRHVMESEEQRSRNLKTIERDLIAKGALPIRHDNSYLGRYRAATLTSTMIRIEEENRYGKTNNGDMIIIGIPHGGLADQHARDLLKSQGLGYVPNNMGSSLVTRDSGFGSSLIFKYPHLYVMDGTTGKLVSRHGLAHLMRYPHTALREWGSARDHLLFDVEAPKKAAAKKWDSPDDPNAGSSWRRAFYEQGKAAGAADDALGWTAGAPKPITPKVTSPLAAVTKATVSTAKRTVKEWTQNKLMWARKYAMNPGDPAVFDIVACRLGFHTSLPVGSFERRLFSDPSLGLDPVDQAHELHEKTEKEEELKKKEEADAAVDPNNSKNKKKNVHEDTSHFASSSQ